MAARFQISDDCDIYLIRSESHEQSIRENDRFERKPAIVNELDSSITLEIDKVTLQRRMEEYYGIRITPDIIISGREFSEVDNNGIQFRLLQIEVKYIDRKTKTIKKYKALKMRLGTANIVPISRNTSLRFSAAFCLL
jgi:hypothetical protein